MKKLLSLFVLFTIISFAASATPPAYSYVYIQGDKITPFYVKVNGSMVARYGKNHCILPKLTAGKLEIEILYQQNICAPQTYTFNVPENGHREFLLSKKDNTYALYDLDNKSYLYPAIQ